MSTRKYISLIFMITLLLAMQIRFLGMPVFTQETPSQPLINETATPIPQNLPWYTVVVFGDNRPSYTFKTEFPPVFYMIVDEMEALNPYAIIGTGDHVGEGDPDQYQELYRVLSPLHNVWLAPGNHDLHVRGSLDDWRTYVGPDVYCLREPIPGWSFVFTNTEIGSLDQFINQTREALEQCNGSNRLVLVLHKPLEPFVNHNLNENGGGWIPETKNLIEEYNVTLVLQGHWHGYAALKDGTTEYMIVGGGGAPLANYPTMVFANDSVKGKYNYLIMVLSPDGNYTYIPVNPKRGEINVSINGTQVIVNNTKQDIHDNPIDMPVIVQTTYQNTTILVAAFYPANTTTHLTLKGTPENPLIETDAPITQAYILVDNRVYIQGINLTVNIETSTSTSKSNQTNQSNNTETNQIQPQPNTPSPNATQPTTPINQTNTSGSREASGQSPGAKIIAGSIFIAILILLGAFMARKTKT